MIGQQQPRSTNLSYISVFSGAEAASLAWEPLGFRPLAFAEVDPFPSAVLKARFPHVPNLGDVTKINWSDYYGKADIVVGGSPCQSFSIAGGRKSLDGESRLMFEYIRAVDELRPRWIVWENVPGALSAKGMQGEKGGAFQCLLRELAKLGYGLCWRSSLNTSEFHSDADVCFLSDVLETQGVPQKYFLSPTACQGILRRAGRRGKSLPEPLAEALRQQAKQL